MTSLEAFLRCRDALLAHREDYDTAARDFAWPALDRFNWALDYFDGMARGNGATALWVLDEQGGETRLSFAQMAERSARVANHLRALGVRRGDRVMLMLGNVPALWDVMLACMKLGAIIIPATTLLTADDLRERIAMGEVGHVVAGATDCAKLDGVAGTFTRIAAGADRAPAGWHRLEDAYAASPEFTPDAPTQASDPLLLYFTSGTTSRPKLVMHTHASYPVGHLSTLYWIGLRPAMSTGTSVRRAGPSMRGAASSRHGMPAPPCSSTTPRASRPGRCWTCCAVRGSRRCARRPRSGAC